MSATPQVSRDKPDLTSEDSARAMLLSLEQERHEIFSEKEYQEMRQAVLRELAQGPRCKMSILITFGVVAFLFLAAAIAGLALFARGVISDLLLFIAGAGDLLICLLFMWRYIHGVRKQALLSIDERLAEVGELCAEKLISQEEHDQIYAAIHISRGVPARSGAVLASIGLAVLSGMLSSRSHAADEPVRYSSIAARNVFGLRAAPADLTALSGLDVPLLVEVRLTGVVAMMGKKWACLLVTEAGNPPRYLTLQEGQQESGLEITSIDVPAGTVEIRRQGRAIVLTFEKPVGNKSRLILLARSDCPSQPAQIVESLHGFMTAHRDHQPNPTFSRKSG